MMAASDVVLTVQWIGSLLVQEANILYGIDEQVQALQEELDSMRQYLQDADARQEENEVGTLVRQVRKLAYDAEDVIDTYIFKVKHSYGSWFMRSAYSVYRVPLMYKVQGQIDVIQASLRRAKDRLNTYGVRRVTDLHRGLVSGRDDRQFRRRSRSYHYDDGDGEFVVGLEEDIRKLVEVLMGEGRTQVRVLTIVGMGGSGKTTLAKKLYNHPYAKECFDCSAWVSVSQEWSIQHVLSEILRKVAGPEETTKLHSKSSVEELVDKLRSILQNKSYMVVLDDVWSREALEEIMPALPPGSKNSGSKIIITTRNREIIQSQNHPEGVYIHEPKPLSELEGWMLFNKVVLNHRTNYEESFVILGKKMLKNCDGLPLAIVALAGLLNTRETIGDWLQVDETVRAKILEGTGTNMYGRVGELLALSYDDLPYELKPCFLYLAVFPEDCQIPVGMLTRMWIAEGLISAHGDMSLEAVALQRLEELSHRFMVQVVRTNFMGVIKVVRLHDLLRDLCVLKAKEQSFLQLHTSVSDPATTDVPTFAIQPRRVALHSSTSFPTQVSHLRSLVLLTRSRVSHSAYSCKETLDLHILPLNFRLLRLLSIWGIKTVSGTLPMQIGNLIHLRYLQVRATNIADLPSSIGKLRNLLTLDYRDVDLGSNVQIKIPNVLQKLVLLRNLFLPIDYPWSVEELKLSTLRNLRTLWGVRLENKSQCLLGEVEKLSDTVKKLKIVVSSDNELKAAFSCPSLMSDGLQTFQCELRGGIAVSNVEPLNDRHHLLKLVLIGEIHVQLSLTLPINLVTLELKNSMLIADPLAAIGVLDHLKKLSLSSAYIGTTLTCTSCSFPQLEELHIESFQNLKTWEIEKGAMPCLKKLEIISCSLLRKFPLGLKYVTMLQQLEFFDMPVTFSKKASEYGWAPQMLRLPHMFADIITHSDSPIDSSSLRKLYEQLTTGIFLHNKTKRYWVTKQHNSYINCFMVYSSGLRLCSARRWNKMEDSPLVQLKEVMESAEDGTMVKVAKLSGCFTVPLPIPYTKMEVVGAFESALLSLHTTYEIEWVIMLEESDGLDNHGHILVDELDSVTTIHTKLNQKEFQQQNADGKPLKEWIRISGGEFETYPGMDSELQVSLSYEGVNPYGLVIKGFIIQPKFSVS